MRISSRMCWAFWSKKYEAFFIDLEKHHVGRVHVGLTSFRIFVMSDHNKPLTYRNDDAKTKTKP